MANQKKQLKVTLIRSTCGRLPNHRQCVLGLGLRKLNQSVVVDDNPCIRGLINKVAFLLRVEEI
jgi:large subunit ribosomal protein L30